MKLLFLTDTNSTKDALTNVLQGVESGQIDIVVAYPVYSDEEKSKMLNAQLLPAFERDKDGPNFWYNPLDNAPVVKHICGLTTNTKYDYIVNAFPPTPAGLAGLLHVVRACDLMHIPLITEPAKDATSFPCKDAVLGVLNEAGYILPISDYSKKLLNRSGMDTMLD